MVRATTVRIHCLQHVPFEGPAQIGNWAVQAGHVLTTTHLWEGEPLPDLGEFDWLVVMGGPMSVHDEALHPWLVAEKRLIAQAMHATKPVLGVCLGSQLLAQVLGARVFPNAHREIGWFPVQRGRDAAASTFFAHAPEEFVAFHWHGEAFDLPAGARQLAHSAATPIQAFEYGTALGVLCHLEMTPAALEQMVRNAAPESGFGRFVQTAEQMRAAAHHCAATRALLNVTLDRMAQHAFRRPAPAT